MARKPKKRDSIVEEARTRYEYGREQWAEIYAKCRDDMNFSDPTDPKQWPDEVIRERKNAEGGARPCLVFDQTQQFVRQVVNTARINRPALDFLPVDDSGDPEMAKVLKGLARQTEYASRADVAYITALDQAVRGGIGFFRIVLEEEPNSDIQGQLCAKIMRVVDFESVTVDPDFTEPDGSDIGWGFVEQTISRAKFKKDWPDAAEVDWQTDKGGWFTKDHVRVVEYFRLSDDGKTCDHYKLSGEDILEQSVIQCEYVPIFPVLGNESWEDGKRRVAGCIRLAKDAQITYNFERNAAYEAVALGPKAPWLASAEAIEGYEGHWKQANRGNLAYLPWNSLDEAGQPTIPKPERISPAGIAAGWVDLSERSKNDILAALGQYEASAGNNPNTQSGRAVIALQDRADVGTYHYVDNLALSIAHCGRVLTQIWPVIYDQAQILRIIGEEDDASFVRVMPDMPMAYAEQKGPDGKKQVFINPRVGKYDVRAVVGPAFQTRQAEAAAEIGELVNGNPQMMALLGDVWVKMRNMPEADRVAKRLRAMLPPQVQQAEAQEEEQQPLPPQVMATLQQAQQEIMQLQQALQQAQQELQTGMKQKQIEAQTTIEKAQIDAAVKERVALIGAQTDQSIAQLNAANQHDMAEMSHTVQLMAQRLGIADKKAEEPGEVEEPEEAKPDVLTMLAMTMAQLAAPKQKTVQIVAPSGAVYQGQINEAG